MGLDLVLISETLEISLWRQMPESMMNLVGIIVSQNRDYDRGSGEKGGEKINLLVRGTKQKIQGIMKKHPRASFSPLWNLSLEYFRTLSLESFECFILDSLSNLSDTSFWI